MERGAGITPSPVAGLAVTIFGCAEGAEVTGVVVERLTAEVRGVALAVAMGCWGIICVVAGMTGTDETMVVVGKAGVLEGVGIAVMTGVCVLPVGAE